MLDASPRLVTFDEPEEQSGIRLPTRRDERRRNPRAVLDVPALIDSRSSWETCQCRDVSLGGVSLSSTAHWSTGSVLDVYFELPTGRAVETRARVVALSPGRAHLSFLALNRKARAAVEAYVRGQSSPVIRAVARPRARRVLPRRS
jgi:hypothetical protein